MREAPKFSAMVLIATVCLATLYINFPGHLSYDSVVQLLEGRSGVYGDWHPPIMSWLLGLGDDVLPGAGLFISFDAALLFLSLLSLAWTRRTISWVVLPVILACALTPQFLIYQGIVWKDVLFANSCIAGFTCLAHAGEHWSRPRLRLMLIGGAALFLALATLARQNGAVALLTGMIALSWIAWSAGGAARMQAFAWGFGALLVSACVLVGTRLALETRIVDGSGPGAQIVFMQTYDVVGAVRTDPSFDLARIHALDPGLERLVRTEWAPLYSLRWADSFEGSYAARRDSDPAFAGAIRNQWLDLVLHHTGLYLKIRAKVFRWVFLTPVMNKLGKDADVCLAYSLGVSGPDEDLAALHMTRRWTPTDNMLDDYAGSFIGTPVLSHATWALFAIAAMAVLAWRRRPADIAIFAMLGSSFFFVATFFLISISCDYRYLYTLDLSAMVAIIYLAMDPDWGAVLLARISRWRQASP